MFQGLLRRAERSVNQVIARALERALVAVPLLVAAGFATAALTVKLVELYGSVTAYGVMAAIFAVIGLVTMAVVGVGTSEPGAAEDQSSAESEQPSPAEGLIDDAADFLTPEVRSVLASLAPMALPGVIRSVGRNLPLVLILAVAAFVISRFGETGEEAAPVSNPDNGDEAAVPPERRAAA
ncbi:hypothetical protein [Hyphomicrobium sp. CS1GBMeth3]|uniref:hypothetical protein n=1 Tax=Hyphomicrobium sp. CS1GBMeth3 TaxID=1892845 RepID=UPI000930EDE6|nr:hypothetical protein [Hyphomicrobium sp. CS1GBMeth3]